MTSYLEVDSSCSYWPENIAEGRGDSGGDGAVVPIVGVVTEAIRYCAGRRCNDGHECQRGEPGDSTDEKAKEDISHADGEENRPAELKELGRCRGCRHFLLAAPVRSVKDRDEQLRPRQVAARQIQVSALGINHARPLQGQCLLPNYQPPSTRCDAQGSTGGLPCNGLSL